MSLSAVSSVGVLVTSYKTFFLTVVDDVILACFEALDASVALAALVVTGNFILELVVARKFSKDE